MVALAWMTHLCPFKNLLQVTVITQKKSEHLRLWFEGVRNRFDQDSPERSGAFKKICWECFLSLMLRRQASREKKCAVEFLEFRLPKEKKMWKSRRRHKKRIEKKSAGVRKSAGAAFKSFSVSFIFGFYFNIHLTIARCKISPGHEICLSLGSVISWALRATIS